jgi:hypothetical protein
MKARLRAGLVSVVVLAATALALPAASSAGGAGLTPMAPNTRAMWLWDDPPADVVVSWAAERNVSEIFVYVAPTVLTDGSLPRLREMKQQADANRIRLTALSGDPAWTTGHAAALAWQRAVVTTGLFAGIHLDVEPYLTEGWNTNLPPTLKSYLALLDKMRAASTLALEADVPFWYGQYTVGGKNLADEVLRRVKAITVMSYRDTATGPNSIMTLSADWLRRGAAVGKRVRLGVETGPLADCSYCTFAEEGATRLGAAMAEVDAATRNAPAFAGTAVHHYVTWRNLAA